MASSVPPQDAVSSTEPEEIRVPAVKAGLWTAHTKDGRKPMWSLNATDEATQEDVDRVCDAVIAGFERLGQHATAIVAAAEKKPRGAGSRDRR